MSVHHRLLVTALLLGAGCGDGAPAPSADAAIPDAAADLPPTPPAPDAGAEAAPEDAWMQPRDAEAFTTCLPDGTGRLAFTASGGLEVEAKLGNQDFCGGSADDGRHLVLTWVAPVRTMQLMAFLRLDIDMVEKGQPAAGRAASVSVSIAGAQGNMWLSETGACLADVTTNQATGATAPVRYKLVGAVRCSKPLPGLRPDSPPLSVSLLEFTTAAVYP